MTTVPVSVSGAAVKELGSFLERFGGISNFLESLLQVPSGYLQHWSQNNLIRWYDKLEAENAKRKAEGRRPIPPSLLMQAFQKIAIEEDEGMLTMWATLFSNFQDPTKRIAPNKLYVHILSEMQPLDAKLLEHVVIKLPTQKQIVLGPNNVPVGIGYSTPEELASDLRVSSADVLLSVYNLNRLGCLQVRPWDPSEVRWVNSGAMPVYGVESIPQNPTIIAADGTYYLSSLGVDLVNACDVEISSE